MMRPTMKLMPLASVLLLGGTLSFAHFGAAVAQDETKLSKSTRGGNLAKTAKYQFEVFFYTNGLRVFPQDSAGLSLDTTKLTGTATFYHPNSPKPWFIRELHAATLTPGHAPEFLEIVIGLGTVPPTGVKVAFEIAGLHDSGEPIAPFTVPFEFVKASSESTNTNPSPPQGVAKPSPRYVYGPGYYGYGYYQYPGPQTTTAQITGPAVYNYGTMTSPSHNSGSGETRDWTTGRSLPSGGLISKPWLRPSD